MKRAFNLLLLSCRWVLVILLAWQLSVLVWKLVYPHQTANYSVSDMDRWIVMAGKPLSADQRWTEARLFASVPVRKPEPKPVNVPKTLINMVLKAVFVDSSAEKSGAIIATLQGKAAYYRIGDDIQPGITLVDVQPDHVVIQRNGKKEFLPFKEIAKNNNGLLQDRSTPEPIDSFRNAIHKAPGLRSGQAQNAVKQLPAGSLSRDIQHLTPKAFMKKYQKKLEDNADQVLGEAGIMPSPAGGYVIGQSPYTPLLTSAGLKVGDVIMSVNGQTLGNPSQDARLVGSLANQREVEVEVRRGSRQFVVSLPIGR
ncbi:type II secretion system protein N [Oceanospirillum sediminis]|uniref:PDZ domain-containing protein n=1 Tax=Oceanospirillum sediminis TaxID=2760088 RepID=A0A839IMX4_9GAMM|nr:type II secretion system protein N [Oceanospirillum sediminis]MBB1485862.1 hypothetical protein [Oceanospirillum sediminis]